MQKRSLSIWIFMAVVFWMFVMVSCTKKVVKTQGTEPGVETQQGANEPGSGIKPGQGEASGIREGELTRAQREEIERQKQAEMEEFINEYIYFDYDSAALTPQAQDILRRKAAWLRKYPGKSVIIEGHCDERGTTEYNLALGDRRAEAVRKFLVTLGIASSRMTTISFGEERPIDPGHNEAAWRKNRRAQFVIGN